MKVIVLGDIHGEFERLNCLIEQEQPDVILQVGDFAYWPRLEDQDLSVINREKTWIYFCEGNNDDIGHLRALTQIPRQPVEIIPRIYYMPRGSALRLDDGRQVLFMGGAQTIDRCRRIPGWDWFQEEIISPQDVLQLPEIHIDIVVSHTCPEEFYVEDLSRQECSESDPSRQLLSQVLHKYQPSLWYFGHWHDHAQGRYQNTRWTALSWAKHWSKWFRILPPVR